MKLKDDAAVHLADRIVGPIVQEWLSQTRYCSKGQETLGPAGPAAAGRGDCIHQVCGNHLKHQQRK